MRGARFLFGLETLGQIPTGRPLIFAANHGSYYDGFFLLSVTREALGEWPAMVSWQGIQRYFLGRQFIRSKAIRLVLAPESTGTSQDRAAICWEIIDLLQGRHSVCLHAEGDMLSRLGPFQPGSALASLETGAQIVPVTLCGVQPLWKKLAFPRRLWGRVTIHFHPAVDPADYRHLPHREAISAMTAEVRARVASVLDYPDGCPSG
jgi:1-acyl-sn-glycerol-3-phosphate acyltransferase